MWKVLKGVGAPHSPRLSHTCVPLQLGPEVAVAGTAGSDFVNASLEPVQSRSWFWQLPTASHQQPRAHPFFCRRLTNGSVIVLYVHMQCRCISSPHAGSSAGRLVFTYFLA